MARIRTIKPDFFTSEDIVSLSPLARLLYIATWLEADRDGRFVWRPKTLKLRYLPGDLCDIEDLAAELVKSGLVVPYEIDGQPFAEIPSFARHQVINNRESASVIHERQHVACPTRAPRDDDACPTRDDAIATPLMGRERKGRERNTPAEKSPAIFPSKQKSSKQKSTPLPDNFVISARVKDWALENGHTMLEARLAHFTGYAAANGKTYADWDQALMNAIRDDWAKLGKVSTKPDHELSAQDKTNAFMWKASGLPGEYQPS